MKATNTSENQTQVPNEKCSMLDARCSIFPIPSSVSSANSASSALNKPVPPPKPKFIDTLAIPFPKTMAELAALDATREIPYLKALCNRRHIPTPGPNPTPEQIIPIFEHILATHLAKQPQGVYPTTDILVEWQITRDDLTQFLQDLRHLLPNEKCSMPDDRCSITPIPSSVSSANSASSALNKPVPPPTTTETQTENPYIKNPSLAFTSLKTLQTSGHSNNSNQTAQKTPAIPTNQNQHPKTLRHSNNSPQKISPIASAPSQSQISNLKSQIPDSSAIPAPKPKPRKIHPILARLTADQKQQLIHIYEQHSAKDAARIASEKLNLPITTGTLSRLYSTWQIAQDNDTREDLEATHHTSIEALTQHQLRLLELASRPHMDTSELRAICQSFARLES